MLTVEYYEYAAWCSVNYQAFQFGWWQQVIFSALHVCALYYSFLPFLVVVFLALGHFFIHVLINSVQYLKGPSAHLQILPVWSYLFSWYSFLYSSNLGFLGLSTPSPQFWRSPGLFLSLLSLHYGSSRKIVYWGSHRTQLVCFPFLKGHSSLLFSILKYIVL